MVVEKQDFITVKIPRWKLTGRPSGYPSDLDPTLSVGDIMKKYNISRATAYRWKQKAGAK